MEQAAGQLEQEAADDLEQEAREHFPPGCRSEHRAFLSHTCQEEVEQPSLNERDQECAEEVIGSKQHGENYYVEFDPHLSFPLPLSHKPQQRRSVSYPKHIHLQP